MITCPECKTEYEKEAKYCFKCRIAFTDDLPENISKYLRRTPSTSNIHTSTNTGTIGKPPLARNPSITGTGITNKPPINGINSSNGNNIQISSNQSTPPNVTSPINSNIINSNNVSPPISNSTSTSSGNLNSLINSGGGSSSNNANNINSNSNSNNNRPRLQSSPVHPTNPLPPIPPNNRMSVPVNSTSPTARTPPPPPTHQQSASPTQQYTSPSNTSTTNLHSNIVHSTSPINTLNTHSSVGINKPPTPPIGTNRNVSPINTPSPTSNITNSASPTNSNIDNSNNYSSPQFTNDYNNTAPMSRRPLSRRIPPPPPNKKLARAKWDCVPDQEGDLGFSAGDIITIISKDDDGSGWWLGSANGKTGLFPYNYVQDGEEEN